MESIRKDLEAVGVTIVGISVDSAEESAKVVSEHGLHYHLLRDADLHVASAYGVAMKGKDIAVPSVFVVRSDRAITWKKIGESVVDRPTAADVLAHARDAARAK